MQTVEVSADRVVRFTLGQRIEHVVLMVSFTMLVLTGLPQKLSFVPWASSVVLGLGGIEKVRLLHRVFAVILILESGYHFGTLVLGLSRRRLRLSMMPEVKDVLDAWTMLRYCVGLAPQPPLFGRYTYREKFEYWGVVVGAIVMVSTGLVLWFPIMATRYLPGELIPACKEAHGGEALLAFLVIIVWHLYGVHLSPVHFPGDFSIFTGLVTRQRMIEEHPLEYSQMTGIPPERLADLLLPPVPPVEVPSEALPPEGLPASERPSAGGDVAPVESGESVSGE